MMIPNYEFKQTHPIYDTNLLDPKSEWSAKKKGTVTKEIHNILVQKILHYPDVMKHQTNVKANMTDWHMHMKDPHFRTLATLVEEIAKEMRYGSGQFVEGKEGEVSIRKGQSPRLQTEECWGAAYGKDEFTQEHTHWPATWSWCYYLQVPEGSSPLVFSEAGIMFEPKVGDLIVFDSSVKHSVPPCQCEEKRIMIAGNIGVLSNTVFLRLATGEL